MFGTQYLLSLLIKRGKYPKKNIIDRLVMYHGLTEASFEPRQKHIRMRKSFSCLYVRSAHELTF